MNFADERYVPFHTRDTLAWLRLPWEGKCLLPQLLRRIRTEDATLELDDLTPVEATHLYTGGPRDFVATGLSALLAAGLVVHEVGRLRLPVHATMAALSDERYVRLYVRNTTTWLRLGWAGQCLLPLVLRSVDRAGVLDIGSLSPAAALAMHTGVPIEFVVIGIDALLELGVVEHRGESLFVPRFVEAQETPKSDALRQRESRERRRRGCAAQPSAANGRQLEMLDVTGTASRAVTTCHSEPSSSLSSAQITQTTTTPETTATATVPARMAPTPSDEKVDVQVESATEEASSVVVSLAEWSVRSGPEVSRAAKAGVTWFQLLLADVATPPVFSFVREYEYIGSRPAGELTKVADHIRQTTWCSSNRRKVTPAHVVRFWADYLAGPRNFEKPARSQPGFTGLSDLPTDEEYAAERAAAAAGAWRATC